MNFSVAIAVYNKEENILSTLQSVLQQSYVVKEIVIVNDGSFDGSEEVILSIQDPRIKYIRQENQGAAAARNKAIANCTHPYIALIDADDVWHIDFLKHIAKAIEKFPEEKVFSTGLKVETKNNIVFKPSYSIPSMEKIDKYNYFEASNKASIILSSAIVLHKDVFQKAGFFDTAILSGQDTDLWIRIGLSFPVVFIPKYLATYRYVPDSLSYSGVALKDKLRFEKFKEEEKLNPSLKKFLDLNRYSLAVSAKENKDYQWFEKLSNDINLKNLNSKQRFILKSPWWSIQMMKRIQFFLSQIGMRTTSF